ncbi:hypothetical protein AZI87_16590 [Bdellovibrio bacteriovorus]|uniref:Uncharacterized protein n=1 Tax=Bdellovibrio bacteriovorus TaxID=959 RepID=A0A161PAF3_BDEBC|nr:hypothetical protein [Bdellovibrio bacteriovorus]KYG62884.1 hypothetical protein AZI87_16590 [Bdellovibrio bacteriovorus]
MANSHFFNYYTIRVKEKRKEGNVIIRKFGDEEWDLFPIMQTYFGNMNEFAKDELKKSMSGKDIMKEDQANNLFYGIIQYGNYGMQQDIAHKDGEVTYNMSENEGPIKKHFYLIFIPPNSTTGAMILHSIGADGISSLVQDGITTIFREIAPKFILEIEPVMFNLKAQDEVFLNSITVNAFERPSKVKTNKTIGSRAKKIASITMNTATKQGILSKIFKSENVAETVLDEINPVISLKNADKYNTEVKLDIDILGKNKTLKINREFKYSTSEDMTGRLEMVAGVPTLESLHKEGVGSLKVLRRLGVI